MVFTDSFSKEEKGEDQNECATDAAVPAEEVKRVLEPEQQAAAANTSAIKEEDREDGEILSNDEDEPGDGQDEESINEDNDNLVIDEN
jgi:hypothetical protein